MRPSFWCLIHGWLISVLLCKSIALISGMCNCYGGLVPVAFESCSAYYLYRMVSEEARKQKNIFEAEFTKEFFITGAVSRFIHGTHTRNTGAKVILIRRAEVISCQNL